MKNIEYSNHYNQNTFLSIWYSWQDTVSCLLNLINQLDEDYRPREEERSRGRKEKEKGRVGEKKRGSTVGMGEIGGE